MEKAGKDLKMAIIKQFRRQTHREVLEANNQKLMRQLSGCAAVLAQYANGEHWAFKDGYHHWVGEGNPEELAILSLKRTFGPDALSQIAKKMVKNG